MKIIKFVLSIVVLFAIIASIIPASAANTEVEAQQSAVDPRFGAVESFWAPAEAADLGVGWERILFYWNEIQPGGPEDWNTLHVPEEWLNEAAAQGRDVVGLLKNTPNWATEGEFAAGVPRGLYLPIEDPGNLWANYVRRVSSYYGQRGVHNWIVWNEPDIAPAVYGHEFSGTIQDYYQLVKVAYQVVKQVDPTARVHLGGMTHWHDPTYLNRYLQVVAADPEAAANNYYYDVISLHIYFRPETISTIVGNAFYVQQLNGISPMKEVWVNETNARPSMDPEWPVQVQSFEIDLEQQAWYIVQAFSLGFYSGAARIAVYKLVDINMNPGDESWGLIRPYDFSRRPAYFAYQNTIKYLSGFNYPIQREQGVNYTIITFNRSSGTTTRVLWARNPASVTLQVPALAGQGLLVDPVTGTETPITPSGGIYDITLSGARCHGECYMGGAPVFLVEESGITGSVPTAAPPIVAPTSANVPSPTSAITPTLTLSPTEIVVSPSRPPTVTATNTATATQTPTKTPSPTQTRTPAPTNTATTATNPNLSSTPVSTLLAAIAPTATGSAAASESTARATAVFGFIPANSASWVFMGAGTLLGGALWWFWRRRSAG